MGLKRHRPAQRDLTGSTPKEVDAEAVIWPLSVLTGVLGRNPAFRDHCARIKDGSQSVEDVARLYVRRDWLGRRVIEHLLRVGATRGPAMLSSECGYGVAAEEPLGPGDRRRGKRSNAQHKRGADLLAELGEGICLRDGCITHPRQGATYCWVHEKEARDKRERQAERDADRRAIREVLKGAAAGLDLAYASRRARGHWSSPLSR